MIKYKIKDTKGPIIHEVVFPISKKEVYRIRNLLEIKSFEGWDAEKLEKLGIEKDSSEWVLGASFDNGASLDYELCCGDNNYFDSVVFKYPDKTELTMDCTYDLDDIEIDAGTNIYRVLLELTDD